jgi:hypothetical protein
MKHPLPNFGVSDSSAETISLDVRSTRSERERPFGRTGDPSPDDPSQGAEAPPKPDRQFFSFDFFGDAAFTIEAPHRAGASSDHRLDNRASTQTTFSSGSTGQGASGPVGRHSSLQG